VEVVMGPAGFLQVLRCVREGAAGIRLRDVGEMECTIASCR
jgi:hypothetical protein